MLRLAGYPLRVTRRHPILVLLLASAILLLSGAGLYGYALHQWREAQIALAEDRPATARNRLGLCLTIWPRSPEVHLLAARAARLSGDLSSAESHLNRCLQLQNGATEAVQLEFLLLRVQAGEVDEVAPALLDLVEKNHPETIVILETVARAYMHRLRYHPAYACLTRWIEETPDTARPYHWRGWVYERLGHHEQAMEDYKRALERDPSLVHVRLRVAEMLLEEVVPQEALPHLEELRKAFPERADVKARLGQCRFLQGQHEEARQLLEEAVQEMPNDVLVLLHLAKLDLLEGQPARAEKHLRRVLEIDPSDTEARYTLVSALRQQGRTKETEAELERYNKYEALVLRTNELLKDEAKKPSRDPARAAELGKLLIEIGRERLGVYWLEQALERDPRHQLAHQALAEYYEGRGEHERAASHRRLLAELPR